MVLKDVILNGIKRCDFNKIKYMIIEIILTEY